MFCMVWNPEKHKCPYPAALEKLFFILLDKAFFLLYE